MTSEATGSLRERKKRATREAIERAAVTLALEHGYENVTVDMICEVAGISQRTFFNYVGTKEGAILGSGVPLLPGERLRAEFLAGTGNVLNDLVEMLAAASAEVGAAHGDLFRDRRRIVRENPELALREFARIEEAESSFLQLVRERLASGMEANGASGRDEEARMLVSLTFGIMHYVAREWTGSGFPDDVGAVIRRAAALARRTIGQAPGEAP